MTDTARLYVLGGANLVRAMKRGLLPLQTLSSTGDPWLLGGTGQRVAQTLSDDQWHAALRTRYEAIPEHLRAAVDYSYFAQQMEAKRTEMESELLAQGMGQAGTDELDISRHQALVALTLTESVQNPLAWQFWGEQHRGVALEIDTAAAAFQAEPGKPRLLRHVRYGARRTLVATEKLPFPGWFEAPAEHAGLREWRLVLPGSQVKSSGDGPVLPIDRGMVTGLYLGSIAPPELQHGVRDLVRLDQRYRQVAVHQLAADSKSFVLYVGN